MNIFTIINLFSVIIQAKGSGSNVTEKWIWVQIIVNAVLLLETLGDLYISGIIKAYRNHFRIWPETFCQILNIIANVRYWEHAGNRSEYNELVKLFEVIVFIRLLKLLTLLYEV